MKRVQRICHIASAILAANPDVEVWQAIRVAVRVADLSIEAEYFRREIQRLRRDREISEVCE